MKALVLLVLVAAASAINYECSTANLNIRSGAGSSNSILWTSSLGDKFQLLATNGVWHQVKAASGLRCGTSGWAHSDWLESCSGIGDCNLINNNNNGGSQVVPVSAAPSAGSFVTPSANLNIRSGASTSNSVLWVANPGDKFQVISSSNGWTSLRAASGQRCGTSGYASSQYLVSSSSSTCSSPPPPSPPSNSYPLYKQCNPSWAQQPLGNGGGETLCTAGCAVSSVAMAVSRYGSSYDPGQLNTWLKSHGGFSGNLIIWSAVSSLGLSGSSRVSLDQNGLAAACQAGRPVIANVNNGGHWVLVTGYAGSGNFYVNDPGYTRSTYAFSAMVPGRFVVYTPTRRVQSVRTVQGGDSSSFEMDDSNDEVGTQIYSEQNTDGSFSLHIVQHNADGTQDDAYPQGQEEHQEATAPLSPEARNRLVKLGKGHFLHPVRANKPKGVMANKPKGVQAGKPKGVMANKPKGVQASKPKGVQASKPKGVQSGKPKWQRHGGNGLPLVRGSKPKGD